MRVKHDDEPHSAEKLLAAAGATGLTFTPGNWDQYQTVLLAGVNVLLMRIGIALFDREAILTQWK